MSNQEMAILLKFLQENRDIGFGVGEDKEETSLESPRKRPAKRARVDNDSDDSDMEQGQPMKPSSSRGGLGLL